MSKVHVVRRCTSEKAVKEVLDEAAGKGYEFLQAASGGTDGNVLWVILAKSGTPEPKAEPKPPEPPPEPPGGAIV